MKRLRFISFIALATLLVSAVGCGSKEQAVEVSPFISVKDGKFVRDGKPYYFVGTNFWYGAILGS